MDVKSSLGQAARALIPNRYAELIKPAVEKHVTETLHHYEYSEMLQYIQEQIASNVDGIARIPVLASDLCAALTEKQQSSWTFAIDTVNQQFEDWVMPIRLVLSPNITNTSNIPPHSVYLKHCQDPSVPTIVPSQYRDGNDQHIFNLPENPTPEQCSRELALYFRTFTHVYENYTGVMDGLRNPLKTYSNLHPDIQESMCNSVARNTTSILPTQSQCVEHKIFDSLFTQQERSPKWGEFDKAAVQCIFPNSTEAYHACVNQTVAAVYKWIEISFGTKLALAFIAKSTQEICQGLLINVAARFNLSEEQKIQALAGIKLFTNLLQGVILAWLVEDAYLLLSVLGVASMAEISGSKSIQAFVNTIGEGPLAIMFIEIIKNTDTYVLMTLHSLEPMLIGIGMVFALDELAKILSNLFREIAISLGDKVKPMTGNQRQDYVEMMHQTPSLLPRAPLAYIGEKVVAHASQSVQTNYHAAVDKLTTLNEKTAYAIERYLNLRVFTSWIWKLDENSMATEIELDAVEDNDEFFDPEDGQDIDDDARTQNSAEPLSSGLHNGYGSNNQTITEITKQDV